MAHVSPGVASPGTFAPSFAETVREPRRTQCHLPGFAVPIRAHGPGLRGCAPPRRRHPGAERRATPQTNLTHHHEPGARACTCLTSRFRLERRSRPRNGRRSARTGPQCCGPADRPVPRPVLSLHRSSMSSRLSGTRGWGSRSGSRRPTRRAGCRGRGYPRASVTMRARCNRFQVMKVVLRFVKSFSGPPEPGSRYDGPGPRFADPTGVGLGRDHVAEVLQRVQDVHRAVLDAVLVAGDQTAADPSVVGVLAVVVEEVAVAVEPLDDLRAHRRLLAQPDRRAEHEDVRGLDLLVDRPASRRGPSRARSCRATRRWRCRGRWPAPRRR